MLRKLNFSKVVRITKKVICLGMGIIMIILSLTACIDKEEDSLPFNIGYEKVHYVNELLELNLTQKIINSDELMNFINENNYPVFNESDHKYSHALNEKVRSYDDLYFKENALILIFFFGTDHRPTKINSVRVEDSFIMVDLARPKGIYTAEQSLSLYIYIIEIEKSYVEGLNEVKTQFISKGKEEDFR